MFKRAMAPAPGLACQARGWDGGGGRRGGPSACRALTAAPQLRGALDGAASWDGSVTPRGLLNWGIYIIYFG